MAHAPPPVPAEELEEPTEVGDDELDEEELRRLDESIEESEAQFARGESVSADVALTRMRRILYGG